MNKKQTLLEKAKKVPVLKRKHMERTPEHIELALAWLKGEITTRQAGSVLGSTKSSWSYIYTFANIFKDLYKKGILNIVDKNK